LPKMGRGISRAFRRDWFEIVLTAIGVFFLALGIACVAGVVFLAVHFADADTGFISNHALLTTSKGYGILLFGFGSVIMLSTGWWLAGKPIKRRLAVLFRKGSRHP